MSCLMYHGEISADPYSHQRKCKMLEWFLFVVLLLCNFIFLLLFKYLSLLVFFTFPVRVRVKLRIVEVGVISSQGEAASTLPEQELHRSPCGFRQQTLLSLCCHAVVTLESNGLDFCRRLQLPYERAVKVQLGHNKGRQRVEC